MGMINNIWKSVGKFISKNIFGLDTGSSNNTISLLNKELDKLRLENSKLKKKLESQEILLEECDRISSQLDESLNQEIEFKLYASIVGEKEGSQVMFEFRHRGIVNQRYQNEDILEYYTSKLHLQELLDKFGIYWLDSSNLLDVTSSGITSSLTQNSTTPHFKVEFYVDSGAGFKSRLVPNVKVINEYDI